MTNEIVSAEVLEKAKTRLAELTQDWPRRGGVCFGETWYTDGKVYGSGHTACHSWLTYAFQAMCTAEVSTFNYAFSKYPPSAKNFLLLNCHSRKLATCSKEACDSIILWLASDECPFSKYILNRDDPTSLTDAGAVILVGPDGATLTEAMWMCKVLRYSVEGSKSLETWKMLYEGGVNPFLALRICTSIATVTGATFGASDVSSHVTVFKYNYPVGGPNGEPDVQQLLEGRADPFCANTSRIFGQDPKGDMATKIQGFCRSVEKDDGWGSTVKAKGVKGPELLEKVLAWQAELTGGQEEVRTPKPKAAIKAPAVKKPTKKTVYLEMDL